MTLRAGVHNISLHCEQGFLQISGQGAATISKMKSLVTVNVLGCHSMTAGAKESISHLIQRDFG